MEASRVDYTRFGFETADPQSSYKYERSHAGIELGAKDVNLPSSSKLPLNFLICRDHVSTWATAPTSCNTMPQLAERVASLVLSTFKSLPQKCKPRTYPDGSREWIPMSGIVLVCGMSHPTLLRRTRFDFVTDGALTYRR